MPDLTVLHPCYELRNFTMLPKTTRPEFLTLIAPLAGDPLGPVPLALRAGHLAELLEDQVK